ncbi:hypothetical protein BGZ94_000826, partial [Podila epigama]
MAASYTPLHQRSNDVENNSTSNATSRKRCRWTLPDRQLTALLLFFWLGCVWVAVKIMQEATTGGQHHKLLLPNTNALLDTTTSEVYKTLTLPLLQLANRTQLISNRCGTVSLPPHLLSFLDNDLHSQMEETLMTATTVPASASASESAAKDKELQTREYHQQHSQVDSLFGARASRYLFALVVQDAQETLPDTFTRMIEAIAVLGPNECHISIVDHGSTDRTKEMIKTLTGYLDQYNHEQQQQQQNSSLPTSQPKEATGNQSPSEAKKRKQHITYTIITMGSKDNSPANLARIKNLALSPMFPLPQEPSSSSSSSSPSSSPSTLSSPTIEEEKHTKPVTAQHRFDRVVFLDAVVTCTEDILELIYQSQLQDADLTCGIDLRYQLSAKTPQASGAPVIDTTATRDILGKPLGNSKTTFSLDEDTRTRFKKRIPFQVSACWSGAVTIRASVLSAQRNPFTAPASAQAPATEAAATTNTEAKCSSDAAFTLLFNMELWKSKASSANQTTPLATAAEGAPAPEGTSIARIVVVPTSQFQYSRQEYSKLGEFDAWGLWPKTERKYRKEREERLVAASHRTRYGYQPSTARYGWMARVREDVPEGSFFLGGSSQKSNSGDT